MSPKLIASTRPLALPWQVGCEFVAASRAGATAKELEMPPAGTKSVPAAPAKGARTHAGKWAGFVLSGVGK